jgi:spore maturation protein CgeB
MTPSWGNGHATTYRGLVRALAVRGHEVTFFTLGKEILVVHTAHEMLHYLRELSESERLAIGQRARARVLAEHSAAHRAAELEAYLYELSS